MSVSLEHTTLDLSGIDNPRLGEPVYLLGGEGARAITIPEVASWQNRSPLEVTMTYSNRLPIRLSPDPGTQQLGPSTSRERQQGALS